MASVAPEMQPLETQIHEGAAADVDTVAKQTLAPSAADAYVRELQGWERGVAEHHAEETPKCPVLHPEHQFRKKWDLAQVGALIYVAFLVPFRIGFEVDLEPLSTKWTVELIMDIYFVIDIGVNFRTGFIDENVAIEMRPNKIARKYAKSWLLIDVVSCLPTAYIMQIVDAARADERKATAPNTKVFKILRLLRLAKLLRLARLKKIIKRHEEEFENLMGLAKVLVAVLAMCYIAHVVACFWYLIGGDEPHDDADLLPQPGWISREMIDVWNVTGDRTEIDLFTRYWTAYYWAITAISTVGFGDISPQTNTERIFSVIIEIFGCLLFAVLIGSLGSMMVGQKLLEEKVSRQLAELREFMQAKAIPRQLRVKIRRYMETLYEQKSGFDEQQILRELPPAMAQELLNYMYHNIIKGVPFFHPLEEAAIIRLCGLLKPFRAMKGDLIYKRREVGRELYIVMKGEVRISFTDTVAKTVGPGQTFGEGCTVDIFVQGDSGIGPTIDLGHEERAALGLKPTDPYKREDHAVALTDCVLKFLTLSDIREVCRDFPAVKAEMHLLQLMFQSNRVHMVQDAWVDEKGSIVAESTVKIAQKMEHKLSKLRQQKELNEQLAETPVAHQQHLKEGAHVLQEMRRSTSSAHLPQALVGSPRPQAALSGGRGPGVVKHNSSPMTAGEMLSAEHQRMPLESQINELGDKLAGLDEKISRKMDGLESALEKQGEMIKALLVAARREP